MKTLRQLARGLRRRLNESRAAVVRRFGPPGIDWDAGIPEELRFWEMALRDGGLRWSVEEFRKRTNPQAEFQAELQALIPAAPGAVVRVLDVGAGPLTTLGKFWPDRDLQITAVDPLAESYAALLARLGIRPPTVTTFGHGEKLLDQFPRDHFDLAYASNSLDHSYDPVAAFEQMLAVVKPGHYVYLWHFANEGLCECYTGMHQWNFDERRGEFFVSDGRTSRRVGAEFAGRAELSCERLRAFDRRIVVAKLRKL